MPSLNRLSIRNGTLLLAAATVVTALLLQPGAQAAVPDVAVPTAATTLPATGQAPRTAVLAGGCFWGMELVFAHVDGVLDVVSGYAGGGADSANYRAVSSGNTSHAESVRITYDPAQVRYTQLLRVYFSVAHDPTEVNRQGPDFGRQYRSAIFAANADQARLARAYIRQLEHAEVFDAPVATEVTHLDHFYPAEDYHQNYAARHPKRLYIQAYDIPKLQALKQKFEPLYRARPARLLRPSRSEAGDDA